MTKFLLGTVYTCVFYLITPLILLRLLWRSIKAPAYRQRWRERLGFYENASSQHAIWFHAVSVGEAEALFPLIKRIQSNYPAAKLLVTCTTPTGSARIKAVLQDSVTHVYLPYDIPDAVKRFLRHNKPKLAVIMETEIWPNLYANCGKQQIPLYIINARLSEKSCRGYQKISALVGSALEHVTLIAAQTKADADRFLKIGAKDNQVETLGNIKFDVVIPQELIQQGQLLKQVLFKDRFVWLLASTHKDEEALFLQIYPEIKQQLPNLVLIIVPRHPERFNDVEKLCQQYGLTVVKRSLNQPCQATTDVYLADTMGELKMLYAAADVAFVGGSMVPVGGHNILEAAAVGVPVMFGPAMTNFKEIAQGVLAKQAAMQCQNQAELVSVLLALSQQPQLRQQLVARASEFLQDNQGAMDRIFAKLRIHLQDNVIQ
jgi:3-deoxy-D-manno-octulosonic-acid transferase